MSSETTNTESKTSESNESAETEEASVSDTSSTSLDSSDDSSPETVSEDTEPQEVEEIQVETINVDSYPIGTRVIDQPLSEPIVAALHAHGLNYLTRYQQALLEYMMLGEDWWVAANLSSSRGTTVGAYLVDVALANPEHLSVIVCVAVPKVREFFTKDLLTVAQFTDLKILMLDSALDEGFELEETPNILIAPVDVVHGLNDSIDMNHVQVLYLDEMEKSLRDCGELVQQVCTRFQSVQRIVQTSYFSATLNPQVDTAIPGLLPHRFRKTFNSREWSIYRTEQTWTEVSSSVLANNLLSRYLILVQPDSILQFVADCTRLGLDTDHLTKASDSAIVSKAFDRLKDNRNQVLFVTPDVLQSNHFEHFETDFLIVDAGIAADLWDVLNQYRKKVRSLLLVECTLEEWQGRATNPIQQLCPHEQSLSDAVLQSLRTQSMESNQDIWTDVVQVLMDSPDKEELIGLLVQTFLQHSRGEVGYVHSSVYKLESRDLFQRRKKGGRPRRTGKRKS